jgi:hypothetical protein
MFMSFLRTPKAWLFTMVILGQNEPPCEGVWTTVFGGTGPSEKRLLATVPREDLVVDSQPSESEHVVSCLPDRPSNDTRLLYLPNCYASPSDEDLLPEKLAPAITSEIRNIEAMRRSITAGGPVEQWRFQIVRAKYQALLKASANDPAVEEVIRIGLARVTRLEQASKAARTIQTILAESHRRDREVAQLERQFRSASTRRSGLRNYQAVGLMQASAQKVDGRKVFVLIGKTGATVAFLDIPPGLDPDPLLARRVGVRGVTHYSEELHARLISVRDLEAIESRR